MVANADAGLDLRWAIINRLLALAGDAVVVGIFVLAVNMGLLDRNAGIAALGWALRSIVQPSVNFRSIPIKPIIPVDVNLPGVS